MPDSAALSKHPTPSQSAYRAEKRAWLEANLPAHWRQEDPAYVAPDNDARRDFERRLYVDGGLAGWTWPKSYGGQGLSMVDQLIANEEIGRLAPPESLNGIGKEMAGPVLLAIGTEEQKQRYLPRILDMSEIWCQGFSEPEAGSDLASLRTRATEDGRNWRIDGSKIWTSQAEKAEQCLLLARTGDRSQKHGSLTLFVVPLKTPGVTVRTIKQATGAEDGFCEVFFDNVNVPADAVIGDVGKGWIAAGKVLGIERAINRMYRAARFENELRHVVSVCRSDTVLSAKLDETQFSHRFAQYFADLEALRRLVRSTVTRLDRGEEIGSTGSLIKLQWSEPHQRFLDATQDILSYASAPRSPMVQRAVDRFSELYLRTRAETIQAGASAVQLDVIANRILNLPRAS